MEGGRYGTLGLAMRKDGINQYREYRDTGDNTDPEDQLP
jgi:hypothetical protein